MCCLRLHVLRAYIMFNIDLFIICYDFMMSAIRLCLLTFEHIQYTFHLWFIFGDSVHLSKGRINGPSLSASSRLSL